MMMINSFKTYLAAFLYGRALMKFHKTKYKEAARIFKKVCQLDPEQERREFTYYYLGRSLLEIGKHDEALEYLSNSYELFSVRIQDIKDKSEWEEFMNCAQYYLKALNKAGQIEQARKIEKTMGGREGHPSII